MIQFNGVEYLYIDIANQYGLDKENWADRINWTNVHLDDLEDHISTADEPILYTKAVQALRDTQEGIETGFIMGLDACSSGIQILSALTGCSVGASNCGLIDTGSREDFYANVTTEMNRLLGTAGNWPRIVVKDAAMTVAYGSKAEPIKAFGEDTIELEAFYRAMESLAPGAMKAMRIFRSQQQPDATEYKWTMPDGHRVIAKVLVPCDKRIEIDEFHHATFTHRSKINAPDEYDVSLAANVTHSIDGWVVREMIRRCDKAGFQMAAIHDSFWCHPNNMGKVRQFYLDTLREIAQSNMLADILSEIRGYKGNLTKLDATLPTKMLNAEYALS